MVSLIFNEYTICLENDKSYQLNSVDNMFKYDFVHHDEEAVYYQSSNHSIKVFKDEEFINSAIICGSSGATGIHDNSAVIVGNDLLICCADKVFSLSLPNLELNWMKRIDVACCFQIFKNDIGIFVHGELAANRIDGNGNIVWSVEFGDILVTADGENEFIMHENFIEITDWNKTKYKVDFNGNFI